MLSWLFGKKKALSVDEAKANVDRHFHARKLAGEAADRLLAEGKCQAAQRAYLAILAEMNASGGIDAFICAKATLGILLGYIQEGSLEAGYKFWRAEPTGIKIIESENHSFHANDECLYLLTCAYFHAFGGGALKELETIDHYMKLVATYANNMAPELKRDVSTLWYAFYLINTSFDLSLTLRERLGRFYAELEPADEESINRLVTRGDSAIKFDHKALFKYFPKPKDWAAEDVVGSLVSDKASHTASVTEIPKNSSTITQTAELEHQAVGGVVAYYQRKELASCVEEARKTRSKLKDPLNIGWVYFYEFQSLFYLGRHEEAFRLFKEMFGAKSSAVALTVDNGIWIHSVAMELAFHLGDPQSIEEIAAKALEMAKDRPERVQQIRSNREMMLKKLA